MRLKTLNLTEIEVYRKISVKSSYIGTENSYQLTGKIKSDIQPAENRLENNPHGKSDKDIINLYICPSADIMNSDRIKHDSKFYEIISVVRYRTHIKAVAELI